MFLASNSPTPSPPTLFTSPNAHLPISTMQVASICTPMRTVVLGSRFSSPLGTFARTTSTSFYQPAAIKQHACLSSFVAKRVNGVPSRSQTLYRPQAKTSFSPILRNTSVRSNSTASAASRNGDAPLDWNSFFRLRASRRRYNLGSSIMTAMATTVLGVQFMATQDLEKLGVQVMGLDPFVVLGLATAASGAAGWLIGPFVGNAVWGLVYRRHKVSFNIVSPFLASTPFRLVCLH